MRSVLLEEEIEDTIVIQEMVTAKKSQISVDEIFDVLSMVDPETLNRNDVGWMMHREILSLIRKLKDNKGYYLCRFAFQSSTLVGYPVLRNQRMSKCISPENSVIHFVQWF